MCFWIGSNPINRSSIPGATIGSSTSATLPVIGFSEGGALAFSRPNRKSTLLAATAAAVGGGGVCDAEGDASRGGAAVIGAEFNASTNLSFSDLTSSEPKLRVEELRLWIGAWKMKIRSLAGLGEARHSRSYSCIMCSRSSSLVTEMRASRSSPGSWYLNEMPSPPSHMADSLANRAANRMPRSTARIFVSPPTYDNWLSFGRGRILPP
ncbi:RING/U-box superfamily protein [Striga asiatica]|uniref:RING/U-box superfamily protein n=1 Tax=Striga asiatica TaxID=4170 RepID=A0A5A7QE34_STRAF|nr:RING/U-box superfamily protein [Striga asiatica]